MPQAASSLLEDQLKNIFGYNSFRPYQKEIIQSVLEGRDVMAILPTGAGKSLCYQLPAMMLPGTAIVVSPLISLMQDQVVSLFKNGIPAAFLNSSLYAQDIQDVLQHLEDYKLLYVAPERFADPLFIQRLKEVPLSLLVVDEAHCISQWGHAFRAEYRKLSMLRQTFPECPIMALTATATPDVEQDIMQQLLMKNQRLIKGSFDRPNLTIRAQQRIDREKHLKAFLERKKGQSGILYAATRKTVDQLFNQLKTEGWPVGRYHAGLPDQERSQSQHAFLHDETPLMVATVAFGMGIHKPDIRFVVHLDMPKTLEQYYQEIGRAGRDGLPAECLLFYSAQDLMIYKSLLEEMEETPFKQELKRKTDRMYRFCHSIQCRRKELLGYFGEKVQSSTCQSCDNCLDDVDMVDGTVIAQKILSCVFRLHQAFGIHYLADVLRGSKQQAILARGHHELSTYGIMKELSEPEVRYYIESLIQMGFLRLEEGQYPIVKWTESSSQAVKGQLAIQFRKKIFKETKAKPESTAEFDSSLFEKLRQLRTEMAQTERVPPYVVFSDRALQEMASYYPRTEEEFKKINGVGPIKWVKYGDAFLQCIQTYLKK